MLVKKLFVRLERLLSPRGKWPVSCRRYAAWRIIDGLAYPKPHWASGTGDALVEDGWRDIHRRAERDRDEFFGLVK